MAQKTTYKDAGVDIEAGNKTVEYIKPLAESTYKKEVIAGIGGFSGLFKVPEGYKEPVLVASTDGVGTKLKLGFRLNKHNTIGIDLVAMCVNDLICTGAKPLFFLDYFATSKLSPEVVKEIIEGIVMGCKEANCCLLGGETAELPGFYSKGEYDLAGFALGVVEKTKIIDGKEIKAGDELIGIESSGLHSNGYSLALKVLFDIAGYELTYIPHKLSKPIGELLLTPTYIYSSLIDNLTQKFKIKAIANITGGGLTENIPRVLPKNISCELNLNSWKKPAIFHLLKDIGNIDPMEMLRTFNNGIGMVIVVKKEDTKNIMDEILKNNFRCYKIGLVTEFNNKEKLRYTGNYDY